MPHAKHIKIECESLGAGTGERTVKLSSHVREDGAGSWLCFTVDRSEMIKLASALLQYATNDDYWTDAS